ncbi:MAG: class I SAM-dependent methyltransferase [Rhodocyclales bacterium]|nr:class I SAM-dependent methyltransferase [Rhodocyclales bacterium]
MILKRLAHSTRRLLSNSIHGNPLDLPRVARQTGTWAHADIEWLASKVRTVAGDFAEIGVFRGAAFRKLARLASEQGKRAHAFDSFVGMNEPAAEDGGHYPKGKFDIGGPDQFSSLMSEAGVERSCYELWPGYVPDCFTAVPPGKQFSLVILDVDHYHPTLDALRWLSPRISPSGILALDDFLPHADILASKAIKEFLQTNHDFERIAFFNQQLILRKLAPAADS